MPERDLKLTGEWWLQRSSPEVGDNRIVCRTQSQWQMWSFAADGTATHASDLSVDGVSVTGTFTTHNGVLTFRYEPAFGAARSTEQSRQGT